nr:CI [Ashitaba mosaic virus]
SLDEWQSIDLEKKLTIDFTMESDEVAVKKFKEHTFNHWWNNQLARSNTLPHYRTEGHFMEFTRDTAAQVANEIHHGVHTDVLLRGAVGSGKSTGLPFHLMKKGKVLLLEPTRPLAENVCKQLRGEPFHVNATLRMRGMSSFGSAPISIMTSGYALHYLVNNQRHLHEFDFIIFDECHVHDASAMAFRSALAEFEFQGKIIKVSATPPGREVEFSTQYPVDLRVEEEMSFDTFVQVQGTGANADVISKGDNILVYVSSYNEVDVLSKKLIERKFDVTKVDGRTMKMGSVEIETHGTPNKKHFIVATNIIENGVTLDIDVVVDFGLKVVPVLDTDNRSMSYKKICISYGERIQRLGRVGRHKRGLALRIGSTEKGLVEVPTTVATEAAFLCFAYGLPVMTGNVSTSLLANCTVQQARTMQHFEASPFYMVNLVRYDGAMHPAIHEVMKQYKLRDSEILLTNLAIPHNDVPQWITARELKRIGCKMALDDEVRIPFYIKDIPEKVHNQIWEAVEKHKCDAGFGRMSSASATKVAYTLQTDLYSIPRTLQTLDALIAHETEKQASYKAMSCQSSTGFSIMSVINALRANYISDHTADNIEKLQRAKAQILEYKNLHSDTSAMEVLKAYASLECVQFQ